MHEQGSLEWHVDRMGCITASQTNCVMARRIEEEFFKSGPRKGQLKPQPEAYLNYVRQVAAERITGKCRAQIKARPLEWGHDVEPVARAFYEARLGIFVNTCGFIVHPKYQFLGASPDFLVGTNGGGEIKCPESQNIHLQTLEEGLPEEHVNQIQTGLFVTGRAFWDFVSFHPDFPAPLNLYIQRINRDEKYIAELEAACLLCERDISAMVERQLTKVQLKEAA